MDRRRELRPLRDFTAAAVIFVALSALILAKAPPQNPSLHTILDTTALVLCGLTSLRLFDIGWRLNLALPRLAALTFAITAGLECLHTMSAIEFSHMPTSIMAANLRPATWPPPAYLLPMGLIAAFLLRARQHRTLILAVGLVGLGFSLIGLFTKIPRYHEPILGVSRPSLLLVPFLWLGVHFLHQRLAAEDRVANAIALCALIGAASSCAIIFSTAPADSAAMVSHVGKFTAYLFLLAHVAQLGTVDTARRMRAERDLRGANEGLEHDLHARNAELEAVVVQLREEAAQRDKAERRTLLQLERLHLLRQITHAIGERQDFDSIVQAVVRRLEESMPVDFACVCRYDPVEKKLTVAGFGAKSLSLASALNWKDGTEIPVHENGLRRSLQGTLVYEPETSSLEFEMPRRFSALGLGSLVVVPLMVEQHGLLFGVLIVARKEARSFSSGECEFLSQLCSQVALASNQAHLHAALQRAYDEMRNTQQAVMQQERLRALGQMASGIAHDVNNAMTPVTLYLESLLEREPTLSARGREQIETMQRATGDIARTIARMGDFYRRRDSQVELAQVNVNVILDQIPDLTRARWFDIAQSQGITIELRIEKASSSPTILAIESELREALINLVLNAVDAMPRGGIITLRSRRVAPQANGMPGRLAIEVVDNGMGMDEETRQHCLEPFYTTKGERGTGLGLAMVYGIAERHGASLEIDSAPGEGTTIRLLFAEVADVTPTVPQLRVQRPLPSLRVLIVDDDPLLLKSLREALELDGHEVAASDGGQAGIDAFRAAHDRGKSFRVVLTDLGMPHVDGKQVAAVVKKIDPNVRVIMLTGWGRRMAEAQELPAHVDHLLGKPPNLWQVRDALAGLIET